MTNMFIQTDDRVVRRTYVNKYGKVCFSRVSETKNVSDIRGEDVRAEHRITMDVAEQITLITENRRMQIAFPCCTENDNPYVILHENSNRAFVAHLYSIQFNIDALSTPSPTEEINFLNNLQPRALA